MLLLHIPFLTLAIAVIIHLKHGGMVFEILVGIDAEPPGVGIIVYAHEPTAQMIAFFVHKGRSLLHHITAPRNEGTIEGFQIGA